MQKQPILLTSWALSVVSCLQFTPPTTTLIEASPATALGLDAVSLNARIQPRGRPTSYYFELGETTSYNRRTLSAPLPPRVGAFYRETWDDNLAGWAGGISGLLLSHQREGDNGFVHYDVPGELDAAHADGIGANALVQYLYNWDGVPVTAMLGGGDPDFRGARISARIRGDQFVQNASEFVLWIQSTPNLEESYDDTIARWSNWAYAGATLTEGLFSGDWQDVSYSLINDTNLWTYAGHYVAAGRETYIYVPLDQVLGHQNGDFFHMLTFFEYGIPPQGSIDIDSVEIAYPNESVLLDSNGGRLLSALDGDDPARLTDGWRNGEGKTWSAPGSSHELLYRLERTVSIHSAQLHQNPSNPSREVEVYSSLDGVNFSLLGAGTLPESTPQGDNFAYLLLKQDPAPANFIKIKILSGYQSSRVGLGEIEFFGEGAAMSTEDDWVSVNADFTGLAPGATYHYRVVAQSEAGIVYGEDQTVTLPTTTAPLVSTLPVSRITGGTAKVEGRVSPLGELTNYYFEFGLDTTYGRVTALRYAGLELTPRTVSDEIGELIPGQEYHVRLVAESADAITFGENVTFIAQ